jgi:hypothetical protein
MRNLKSWAVAFVIATGAFWLILAKDPPKSAAAGPGVGFSTFDIKVPSNLPSAEGGNTY